MLEDFDSLENFVLLCETGSIQRTAELLDCDKSSVSRKLAKLEKKLGRKLFEHDKRPLLMTNLARSIYPVIQNIIDEKNMLENQFKRLSNGDSMTIRLMIGNGHINFAPRLLKEYSEMFPSLSFNVISPPDVPDFLAGKAEVICLSGQQENNHQHISDCVLLPRGHMIFVPVASPEYIKKYGQVSHPSQLVNHRVYTDLYAHRYDFEVKFRLVRKGESWPLQSKNNIRFSNVLMVHKAALEGDGIALCLPIILIIKDLEEGRLVPILDGWHRPSHQNYVACKKEDWKNKTLRSFSDWWAKRLNSYEKECENRLARHLGRDYLLTLLKN